MSLAVAVPQSRRQHVVAPLSWRIRNAPNLARGALRLFLARALRIPHLRAELRATLFKADGTVVDYGVVSRRVITNAGAEFIAKAFQNLTTPPNMKYHAYGTGTAAESVNDTQLGAESTSSYQPANTRPAGTASGPSANVYRSVATFTPNILNPLPVTEHGLFDSVTPISGTLLDRSVFATINLQPGDSLQTTYDLTIVAGG